MKQVKKISYQLRFPSVFEICVTFFLSACEKVFLARPWKFSHAVGTFSHALKKKLLKILNTSGISCSPKAGCARKTKILSQTYIVNWLRISQIKKKIFIKCQISNKNWQSSFLLEKYKKCTWRLIGVPMLLRYIYFVSGTFSLSWESARRIRL